jgi:hypothetical protein
MYSILLVAHSWLRWIVLLTGVALLATACSRGFRRSGWGTRTARLRIGFLVVLDTQVLFGLVLYLVFSPIPRAGLADVAATLGDTQLRFYTIEHAFGMLMGAVIAHAGLVRSKDHESSRRHRSVAVTLVLWLLVTAASVPWPWLPYGRPLFRLG